MRPEARKLARLRRLEKIRALAKQEAAQLAAEAEGALSHLRSLETRTRAMADAYRDPGALADGQALRQQVLFTHGLAGISAATSRDATAAQVAADARQLELALAERRRAAVEDRALASARAIAQRQSHPAAAARKPVGTELE